jgi:hypothetical protein
MKKKTEIKVPPLGSLGLLATGHLGLLAWRKARKEAGLDPKPPAKKEE